MSTLNDRFGTYVAQPDEYMLNKKHIYSFEKSDPDIDTMIVYGPEKGWRVNTMHL